MKRLTYLAVLLLAALSAAPTAVSVSANADNHLPTLHKIQAITLSPSYSCRSVKENNGGYLNSALFISRYSQQRNAPDLLFNGACRSQDYFQGSTAGDDMSLIADLGEMRLEDVSASKAFNTRRVVGFNAQFAENMPVLEKHAYALLINKSEFRGLVVFRVEEYVPNKSVK